MCECRVCTRSAEFEVQLQLIPESQRPYFEALFGDLQNAEMELNHAEAILDGSWPSAQEVLEEALVLAKSRADGSFAAKLATQLAHKPVFTLVGAS